MPTRFKAVCWLLALAAGVAAADASPVLVDGVRSRIEISVGATVGSFVAGLRKFDLSVGETAPAGTIVGGVFRFNFTAIETGIAARDSDMNAWQQTDKFPDVVFTLTALEPAQGGGSVARGQLLFHGVERSVSFPISIETRQGGIAIDGDVAIDTRDYGLPIIRKFLVLTVSPIVHVHFHILGKLTGS